MERDKLGSVLSALSESDKMKIYSEGLDLSQKQNRESNVSCLPTLQLSDISKEGSYPALESSIQSGIYLQSCEQPTNEILYFKAFSSITSIPDDLMLYVPLFCSVVTSLGAGDMDHREFSQVCDLRTGGLYLSPQIVPDHSCHQSYQQGVVLSSHCLQENIPYMFSLWQTLCSSPKFNDMDLLSVLIKMAASDVLATISNVGHKYAMMSASAALSPVAEMIEMFFGFKQVVFLKNVVEEDIQSVANKLEAIAAYVFESSQMRCSVNGDANSLELSYNPMDEFLHSLPGSPRELPAQVVVEDFTPSQHNQHHAMPYPVNYVSTSVPGSTYCHADMPALKVLSRLMTNKFLHREIREKGGAYGGGATVSNGTVSFFSYRDPNALETLKSFENCMNWACSTNFESRDVFEAKLGVFSQLDSPVSPGYKGSFEFLSQVTQAMQKDHRSRLFAVDSDALNTVAKKYFSSDALRSSCIIGPESEEVHAWSKSNM
jgi:Zn-dependent M16 (insulinase) family peptidase